MGKWRFYNGLIWNNSNFETNEYFDIHLSNEKDREIHLTESSVLVPGLIDFHVHLWAPGADVVGVTDSEFLSSGVIACSDAGTFGYNDWQHADRLWQNSSLTVRSWLSVLPEGLTIHPNLNPTDPKNISKELLIETVSGAKDRILGFKVRLGQVDKETDRGLLRLLREVTDESKLRAMVHLTDTYLPIEEVLDYLRPGDILTHPYHGKRGHILNEKGKVSKAFIEKVESGLILDIGQGSKHFSWDVFKQAALIEGIKPDLISSDLVRNTWKKAPVKDMSYIISRFISAGLTKEEVFQSMYVNAADILNVDTDMTKNLLVMNFSEDAIVYGDAEGNEIIGNKHYYPHIFIKDNRSVFVNEK